MRQLEVGDKMVHIYNGRNGFLYYRFEEIERFTKTQIVLKNDIRLKINPENNWRGEMVYKEVAPYSYDTWELVTPKILREYEEEMEHQTMLNWFDKKKFSNEEKKLIYKYFEEKNLL